nr:MAG TPA: hypothetical protein [Caudoviricetes sp.]
MHFLPTYGILNVDQKRRLIGLRITYKLSVNEKEKRHGKSRFFKKYYYKHD